METGNKCRGLTLLPTNVSCKGRGRGGAWQRRGEAVDIILTSSGQEEVRSQCGEGAVRGSGGADSSI